MKILHDIDWLKVIQALQYLQYRTEQKHVAESSMPSFTDARIEELCTMIRAICSSPLTARAEVELKTLAKELRAAIRQHVEMAKISLSTKQSAIRARDPDPGAPDPRDSNQR